MADDIKIYIGVAVGIVVVVGIVLAISLPLAAYESLEPTEVGLAYSAVQKKINTEKLFESGRHYLGLHNSFKAYPTQLTTLEFPDVSARSQDGLTIEMNITYQYKLAISLDNLIELFYYWPKLDYNEGYRKISLNAIRDAVAQYPAFDFVYNRSVIEQSIKKELQTSLEKFHAVIDNFQLLDIEYPTSFEGAISETQNANLTIQSAIYNQSTVQNEADGKVLKAEKQSEVIVNNANITANSLKKAADAEIASTKKRIEKLKESLVNLQSKLNMDKDSLINYQWLKTLESLGADTTMAVNYKLPTSYKCIYEGGC